MFISIISQYTWLLGGGGMWKKKEAGSESACGEGMAWEGFSFVIKGGIMMDPNGSPETTG